MGSGKSQTIGFNYFMGLHFIPCYGPVDAFLEWQAANLLVWTGVITTSTTLDTYQPNLFGGDQREGGLTGSLDIMMGDAAQMPNAYLEEKQALPFPVGYRGLLSFVARGSSKTYGRSGFFVGSNNPYTKPWAFRLARAVAGWQNDSPWYPETALVTLSNGVRAMNPVHIIYQVLTDSDFGKGYSVGVMDDVFCRASALQCFNEGMGLCMRWLRTGNIEDFIQTVCDLAALNVRPNRQTGLTQIKCIRADYDIATLLSLTNDDVIGSIDNIDQTVVTGSTNEITGTWFDPTTRSNGALTIQSLGSIQAEGVVVTQSKSYLAIGSADLVARVIQRDLRVTAIPLRRLKGKFKPRAWGLAEGDAFLFTYPTEGIYNDVFRVGEIDYGDIKNAGISITAVEDVYQFPDQSYAVVQASGWTPPNKNPTPAPFLMAFEASYRDVLREGKDPSTIPAGGGYAGLVAEQPGGLALNYELWVAAGGAVATDSGYRCDWTPDGITSENLQPFDTACTLQSTTNLDMVTVGQMAVIENERVRIDAVNPDTGELTIGRGCEDTQAVAHPAAARMWFIDEAAGTDGDLYYAGEVINFFPSTWTSIGYLPLGVCPEATTTIHGRALLPYPPVGLAINGTRWDQITHPLEGALSFAWFTRNRIVQDDQLIDSTEASIAPEAGCTYTITIYASSGAVITTAANVSSPFSYTPTITASDTLTVKIWSVNAAGQCLQPQVASFVWVLPLAITTTSVPFASGTPGTYQMTATGGTGAGYTWSVDVLPAGVTMDASGLLTYDGTEIDAASNSTFTVTDSGGDVAHATIPVGMPAVVFTPASLFAHGERGAWWDYSDLSTMFQDAAGTIPVTAAGQTVNCVKDKSGNGNHLTSANGPVLGVDGGGFNILQFSGASANYLATSAANNLYLGTQSVVVVSGVKFDDASSYGRTVFARSLAGPEAGRYFYVPDYPGAFTVAYQPTGSTVYEAGAADTAMDVRVQTIDLNRVTSSLQARKNGLLVGAATALPGDAGTNYTNARRFIVGAYNDSSDTNVILPMNGSSYGMIVRLLATNDNTARGQTETWMAGKCGVTF